jgi:hypothetical protein
MADQLPACADSPDTARGLSWLDDLETDLGQKSRPAPRVDRTARDLEGTVRQVRCFFDDSETVVAELTTGTIVRGRAGRDELQPGMAYRFFGRWETHHRHGDQFVFRTFAVREPHTRQGVVKYLSRFASGVGERKAAALWSEFGEQAVEVLRTDPARVVAAGILSEATAQEAARDLAARAHHEATKIDLYALFSSRGFPADALINACISRWGAAAAARVRHHPFDLLGHNMPGCGFDRVDRMYLDFQYPPDRLIRQIYCAWSAIKKDRDGHTWHSSSWVAEQVYRHVNAPNIDPERAIRAACRPTPGRDPRLARCQRGGGDWVAIGSRARNEQFAADALLRLMSGPALWPAFNPRSLTSHQAEQLARATAGPVGLLSGGPGTGKTFTTAELVRAVVDGFGPLAVAVVAPTGKAAVRCTEAMQRYGLPVTATTIHRLLKVAKSGDGAWQFEHGPGKPLMYQFLIVDEASMLGTDLFASLLAACAMPVALAGQRDVTFYHEYTEPPRCRRCGRILDDKESIERGFGPDCARKVDPSEYAPVGTRVVRQESRYHGHAAAQSSGTHLLFVGDPGQLPPIDHGAPLRDMIRSRAVPCGELSEVHRNGGMIVRACADIRAGRPFETTDRYDPEAGANLRHFPVENSDDMPEVILSILRRMQLSGSFDPVWDVQILTPLNKKSPVSRCALNDLLQEFLNPGGKRCKGNRFRGGDKVICLANNQFSLAPDGARTLEDVDRERMRKLRAEEDGEEARTPKVFVANGDIGRVVDVAPKRALIEFQAPLRRVVVPLAEEEGSDDEESVGSIDLAYAITGHKSQGSQWPCVIVLIDRAATYSVASREYVYTVISRAEKLCILVGQRSVLEQQCQRQVLNIRKTFLAELLQEGTL